MQGPHTPLAVALLVAAGGALLAQETTRVSVDSSGAEANERSSVPRISADGRVVAFVCSASNLVAGDTNGASDVFVHDRMTGVTERVSVDSSGNQGSGDNPFFSAPDVSISADGQIVAFSSQAPDLVAHDTNGTWDVFVHDRSTGITERVSVDSSGVQAKSDSFWADLSANGLIVTFSSSASNLIPGDTNGVSDIFVHDRATGITQRVSVDSSGGQASNSSYEPSISADGNAVTFINLGGLVSGDTNGVSDIFVHDRTSGITERVSVDSAGAQANDHSNGSVLSADGRYVAFSSRASNLVSNDRNGGIDVFVHDRSTGVTERASVDSSDNEGNSDSGGIGFPFVSISEDGRLVAFVSAATNLVANDMNGTYDIFTHDRFSGVTERVSVDSMGNEGNGPSGGFPSISASGQLVAFPSIAFNLVPNDTNGFWDIFVRDRCAALWSNYGDGFPGTLGVPTLTSRGDPVLGSTITIDLGNSYGFSSFAALLVGAQQTDVSTGKGGHLLVLPALTLVLVLGPSGASIDGDLPDDSALCGLEIDLQGIELDPGAANGVSFTPGLRLILGR